ncbi:endonuclease III [Patescibacteria group bacterium]|nr:endonuclease III [Patescibacteria group bacterium]MBU1015500.1 endonuclease III [Patescibacteria group bacterium]MBU1685423.1 endonuclease III [Patescibacteria group bacterium]MBU1938384.1 endonuclease III [Patescibacteria group bacterium]
MTKRHKAEGIMKILDRLYPKTPIPLKHKQNNHFTFLVAVLLSARATDKVVNKITPALFKLADTPEKMMKVPVKKIREIIKPIGLSPAKAKNIKALSKILAEEFGGRLPASFAELESLPGVGHKTASVVMAQAFNQPAFPVDTHIHRLAHRWGLSNGKSVTQTERDMKKVFPKERWRKLHLQMIFFGREHCPALRHKKDACPICAKYGHSG